MKRFEQNTQDVHLMRAERAGDVRPGYEETLALLVIAIAEMQGGIRVEETR